MTERVRSSASPSALPSKLFFRIGEVAGLVGVEPHVLRYWEREFRAIRPTKSSKGQRVYSRKDVENLLRVRALLYEEGFTIAGAKKKLARPGSLEPEAATVVEHALREEEAAAVAPITVAAVAPIALAEAAAPADAVTSHEAAEVRASLLGLRADLEDLLSALDDDPE